MTELELFDRLLQIKAETTDEHTRKQVNDLMYDRWGK